MPDLMAAGARLASKPTGSPLRPPSDLDSDQGRHGTHRPFVAVQDQQPLAVTGQSCHDTQTAVADPAGELLVILADALDDIERTRIANENRLRSLLEVKHIAATDAAAISLAAIVDDLGRLEKRSIKDLERAVAQHPLGPWVKRQKGVGFKQAGRLLAAIGDPLRYWIEDPETGEETEHERTVSKLWAYCGLHVVDGRRPRRQRGIRSNWSSTAKMRAVLVAKSCIYQRESPYRPVYDAARAAATTKLHIGQCQNSVRPPGSPNGCGTQAHPEWGAPGSPWRDGHCHQHAISVVAKAILKDIWIEARDLR